MASTKTSTKMFYLGFLPLVLASVLCFAACTESAPGPSSNRYRYAQSRPIPTNNIDFGCTQLGVDCSPIARDGSCFYPNTTYAHASVVMKLHYKAAAVGDCIYEL
ncbi:hypothetical protein MKW98_003377 [Papaver atlanticum]|uniref:X8 domain-containing protein n=1 Tax=Papaver atlanticum TaxID=357466 RepID=A0AAD4XTN4_9MAGN|nr:hypothetical protein MKW98_003377 [Papaver atlanticum]